jgi:hypothetical protein
MTLVVRDCLVPRAVSVPYEVVVSVILLCRGMSGSPARRSTSTMGLP